MPFTEYKFDPEKIRARVQEVAANIQKNFAKDDYEAHVVEVFKERLRTEEPLAYRWYGPYWWAVKDVLKKHGADLGADTDTSIASEYRGESDIETLIMADEFRNLYLASYILGTNSFMLDGESGETWTLKDKDMEKED